MIKYCKNLKFEEDPDYEMMRQPLMDIFKESKYEHDMVFDWTVHAEVLEKNSTYTHLVDKQRQLERRSSARRLNDPALLEEKYLRDNIGYCRKRSAKRRTSTNQLMIPLSQKEEISMAVNFSSACGPDGTPVAFPLSHQPTPKHDTTAVPLPKIPEKKEEDTKNVVDNKAKSIATNKVEDQHNRRLKKGKACCACNIF